jgi:pimeloyl-ACP methyl ester carboxylesterase
VFASAFGVTAAEMLTGAVRHSTPGVMARTTAGRLHVLQAARPGPTIVFESGLNSPLSVWTWVAQSLPEDAAFLAYDRPGVGWSDRCDSGWRGQYPDGLAQLLWMLNARAPYILVGHSLGGLMIRMFAHRYPEATAGLVFVDPAHPRQFTGTARRREGLTALREDLARQRRRGLLRLPVESQWADPYRSLPGHLVGPVIRAMSRPASIRAAQQEVELSHTRWAEGAAELASVSCPVAVVTAEATHEMDPGYAELVAEIAGISPLGTTEVVPAADHMSLLTQRGFAVRVAQAIESVKERHSAAANR